MVNDSFLDLPFFGSEESVWSDITNLFLEKKHTLSYLQADN